MDGNKGYRNLEIECCNKEELDNVLDILDKAGLIWYNGDEIDVHRKVAHGAFNEKTNHTDVCILVHDNNRITYHTRPDFKPDYKVYEHIYADEFIGTHNGTIEDTPASSDISIEDFLYD